VSAASAPADDPDGRRDRTRAFAALIAGGAMIAFAPIFVRVADTGPVASAFWRTALAVPFLWLWARTARRHESQRSGSTSLPLVPVVLAGLFFAGDLAVWHVSILFTSVANSTLLANLAPIFVTLGAWFLFGQRVTPLFLAGMALALAGAVLLVGPNFSPAASDRALAGDALGVLTAVFYGAYMLAIARAREHADTASIMARSTTVCALVLLPVAVAFGDAMLPRTATGWLVVLGLALVCQTVGQSLIAYAMAHLPASFSSVSLLVQPVLAAAYAWLLLGERVGIGQTVGGVVVLAGILLARRGS
jgi:drug/metabolite transporter (DMT)-like permease